MPGIMQGSVKNPVRPGSIIIPGLWYPLRSSSRFIIERTTSQVLNCRVMRDANVLVRVFCFSEEAAANRTAAITVDERLYARLLGA